MNPTATVLHFGGNGHSAVRVERARLALGADGGPELIDVPYPGFEGRPGVGSLDAFLASLAAFGRSVKPRPVGAVASGIGALIALSLRARGELRGLPMVFQGPVLWGLERRLFPKLMRPRPARRLLRWAFTLPPVRARFARTHFRRPPDSATSARFFDGYADCPAFADFFDWFTPGWLRHLESAFRADPGALGRVVVWIGGHDHVVGRGDVDATARALGVRWPVVEHPDWGHYPALDDPDGWAKALVRDLATARGVPGPIGPEAR